MIVHKSAVKRARQNIKLHEKNKSFRTRTKHLYKDVNDLIDKKDKTSAEAKYKEFCSVIDKGVNKKIYHRNSAARRKSILSKKILALQ